MTRLAVPWLRQTINGNNLIIKALVIFIWKTKEKSHLIKLYHSFLVWDMTKKPFLTKVLEILLQPLIGKSVVMYFENKEN